MSILMLLSNPIQEWKVGRYACPKFKNTAFCICPRICLYQNASQGPSLVCSASVFTEDFFCFSCRPSLMVIFSLIFYLGKSQLFLLLWSRTFCQTLYIWLSFSFGRLNRVSFCLLFYRVCHEKSADHVTAAPMTWGIASLNSSQDSQNLPLLLFLIIYPFIYLKGEDTERGWV